MKNLSTLMFLVLMLPVELLSQTTTAGKLVKSDFAIACVPSDVKIKGYLGEKIDLCINNRIKTENVQQLIDAFKTRNETHLWQTEFWGKWILSAIAAYDYNKDPELLAIIKGAVAGLLSTQTPDGYIGNYAPGSQLQHWDIWGRKYTLLGLMAYYDISKDKKALEAARRVADHLLTQVGPGKADIVKTGNYHGMPSCSILEPMVLLYNHTGEQRYLDFAVYIASQLESPSGPGLISKAFNGVDVAERFPHPSSWWSWENGQKAYEMMSCYEGLLELYRVTGDASYLKATEMAVKNIIDTEINLAGSGTAFECFYHGARHQTEPTYHTMETCVTFTWMKLCYNLLRLTGNPAYGDQIEKSTYNALLASMKYDGSQIAKYSPLEGRRHEGEQQCGMHINCCNANGPRAFALLPRFAMLVSKNEIFVNLYCEGSATATLGSKNKVSVAQTTSYPVSDKIMLKVDADRAEEFAIALRIPAWSSENTIMVNGVPEKQTATPGSYFKITRKWTKGDIIEIQFDMQAHIVELNGRQAIVRGPVLLARDTRFGDGFVDEAAIVEQKEGLINLQPSETKPENIWMTFTAPLVLGTDLEGEFREPKQIHFCDFSSAGNTWDAGSRYKVWIPRTLNVMKMDYRSY